MMIRLTSLACLAAAVAVCLGEGTVQVLEQPYSVYLPESHAGLTAAEVPEAIAQLMGLTSERPEGWTGRGDVLHRPEGWLVLNVHDVAAAGVRDQLAVHDKRTYALTGQLGSDGLHSVVTQMQTKFGQQASSIVRATQSYVQTFGQLDFDSSSPVPPSKTKLPQLREDIANLNRLEQFLRTHASELVNDAPDLFAMDISGLADAAATSDDVAELMHAVKNVAEQLSAVYKGNDMVWLLATTSDGDALHVRHKRQALGDYDSEEPPLPDYEYRGVDFTAMFGVLLFVTVFLIVFTCGVMCNFWYMDPGKDTIIYRMTMTRAKKD